MKSQEIQAQLIEWVKSKNFNAPYGILDSAGTGKSGKPYLRVTFGRAGTLDVEVRIYNKNFIQIRSNRHGSVIYKSLSDFQQFLETL